MARKSILVVVALVLSAVGLWAQVREDYTVKPPVSQVISGEDIGVRVSGAPDKTGRVQGTLVARIDGQWVDVVSPTRVVPVR